MPAAIDARKAHGKRNAQQAGNRRAVDAAVAEAADDVCFGRVVKMLGNGRLSVLVEEPVDPKKPDGPKRAVPRNALIRGLLRHRRKVPIQSGDVVVMSVRVFEERADETGQIVHAGSLDVIGVADRKDAARLRRDDRIPAWMVAAGGTDIAAETRAGAGAGADDDIIEFEEAEEEGEESGSDDGVDDGDGDDTATAVPMRDGLPLFLPVGGKRLSATVAPRKMAVATRDDETTLKARAKASKVDNHVDRRVSNLNRRTDDDNDDDIDIDAI